MASVINFDDHCVHLAQTVLRGKGTPYVIFSIDRLSNTCIPHPCDPSSSLKDKEQWEKFTDSLPKDNCAYGIVTFKYLSPADGVRRSKTVFVLWAPERAPVKEKMMLAFSSKGIKKMIGGGGIPVQAEGAHELDYEHVLTQVLSRLTVK